MNDAYRAVIHACQTLHLRKMEPTCAEEEVVIHDRLGRFKALLNLGGV
jgi:hypothetical protein